jgi:hypothetical protein
MRCNGAAIAHGTDTAASSKRATSPVIRLIAGISRGVRCRPSPWETGNYRCDWTGLMYAETPRLAPLLRALQQLRIIDSVAAQELARSQQLHNAIFLLQRLGGYPLRFRFKGALLPYSEGLERVARDYRLQRPFVDQEIAPEMSADERAALARFEDATVPPPGFTGGLERWIQLPVGLRIHRLQSALHERSQAAAPARLPTLFRAGVQ